MGVIAPPPSRLRLALAIGLGLIGAPALAAEPLPVEEAISRLADATAVLTRDFLAGADLERRYEFTARLSDGQLYFLTKDYDRAAMVLLDLVEQPRSQTHPGYRDALFYLAESLYRTRNDRAATRYYEQVLVRGTRAQQQQGVARLLDIALRNQNREDARRHLERARALYGQGADPALIYAVGRYYYRVGSYDEARRAFGRVSAGTAEFLRARYHIGVIDTRGGRLDDALSAFRAVVDAPAFSGEGDPQVEENVRHQAMLAIARLHYERGRLDMAVDAYNLIPRESPLFDEAMYESVWISIKDQDWEQALRKLEILLISQPEITRNPDARLLQGKLLMMLGRYGEATEVFDALNREFEAIRVEMAEVGGASADLEAHFNRLIGANIAEFDLESFLPERAAAFAGPDTESAKALGLVSDLAAQRRDIDDSKRTLERLEVALAAESRVEIFPRLHEGWLRSVEARHRVVELRGRINEEAAARLAARPADYAELREARMTWAERYDRIPKSKLELQARDARVDDEMVEIDRMAFEVGLQIRAVDAQLVAIDKYVRDAAGDAPTPAGDRAARAQVEREMRQTKALRAELAALQRAIETERLQVGVNDYASREDERIRRRFLDAVEAEANWLARNGAQVDPALRARLDAIDRVAADFQRRAEGLVDERVESIRRQIERERRNVEGYASDLEGYTGATESLGGAIAARGFRHVFDRVTDILLQADVGLLDVVWKHKQDKSTQIGELRERQREEYRTLEGNYTEVVGD